MVARGLLKNPAMFSETCESGTPVSCIRRWVELNRLYESTFTSYHQHLMFMGARALSKSQRREFNQLNTTEDVNAFLETRYGSDFSIWGLYRLTIYAVFVLFRRSLGQWMPSEVSEEFHILTDKKTVVGQFFICLERFVSENERKT